MADLGFRITMTELPPLECCGHARIEAGLQYRQAVVQSQAPLGESLLFSGELRLKAEAGSDGASPVFLGPFTHGPPSARFLYVVWTGEAGGAREMFRRMKIHLGAITWDQLAKARRHPGLVLEARVTGRDRHGGPACASVPLLDGGWRVVRAP